MKKLEIAILFLLLVGCSFNETVLLTTTPGILATSTSLPTQTMVSTQTLTSTSTPITTLPTWTPLPTFSPTEGMEVLKSWLQGTDNCLLPCWGGITPGKTSWQETKQLLEPLSGLSTVNISENINCEFGKCNGIGWSLFPQTLANGGFYSKFLENRIHLIMLEVQDAGIEKVNLLENISLEMILSRYGIPAILLFFTEPDLPGQIFLELTFIYPERQFIIRYSKYAKLDNANIVSCGPDSYIKLVILDNREQLMSLNALANAVETKDLHFDAWHKSVDEAIGMTINEFYKTYSKANAPCISTPTKIWLP